MQRKVLIKLPVALFNEINSYLESKEKNKLSQLCYQYYTLFSAHHNLKTQASCGIPRNYTSKSKYRLPQHKIIFPGKKIISTQRLLNGKLIAGYDNGAIDFLDEKGKK